MQVGTGVDIITIYAPRIFMSLHRHASASNAATVGGGDGGGGDASGGDGDGGGDDRASTAAAYTILVGVVFCAVSPFAIAAVDRCGRRRLLILGGGLMTLSLGGLALATALLGERPEAADGGLLPPLCVGLVLLYVAAFSLSWGPVAWVLPSELVSTRLRARVVALGTVLNWTADYAVVGSFLSLNAAIGEAGSFALYALVNAAALLFVCLVVPETKGRPLEDAEEAERQARVPAPAIVN